MAPPTRSKVGESFMEHEKTICYKIFLLFQLYFSYCENLYPPVYQTPIPPARPAPLPSNQASLSFRLQGTQCPNPFSAQENPLAAPRPRDSAASPPSTSIRVGLPRPSPFASTLQRWPAVPAAGAGQTAPAADDGGCGAGLRRPAELRPSPAAASAAGTGQTSRRPTRLLPGSGHRHPCPWLASPTTSPFPPSLAEMATNTW